MDLIQHIWSIQSGYAIDNLVFLMAGKGLFGVPFSFVLIFFIKLTLLFASSAVISKLLKLDKAYEDLGQHN